MCAESVSQWWPRQLGAVLDIQFASKDEIVRTGDIYRAAGRLIIPVINAVATDAGVMLKMPSENPPIVPASAAGNGKYDAVAVITFMVLDDVFKSGHAFDWLEKLREKLESKGMVVTNLTTTVHVS